MKQTNYFFTILCFLLTTIAHGQFRADSLFIYKEFQGHGTTAALWHNHRILDSINAKKVAVDTADLTTIKDIFSETKSKRFYQQKHGWKPCYALVFEHGKRYEFVIEGSLNSARLVNLTTMRSFTIHEADSLKSQRLHAIKNKYWP